METLCNAVNTSSPNTTTSATTTSTVIDSISSAASTTAVSPSIASPATAISTSIPVLSSASPTIDTGKPEVIPISNDTTTFSKEPVVEGNGIKSPGDDNKSSADEPNPESIVKLKRCRHGRIIVKDSSKKKQVQTGDKEAIQIQTKPIEKLKEPEQLKDDEGLPIVKDITEVSLFDKPLVPNHNEESPNNELKITPKCDPPPREPREKSPKQQTTGSSSRRNKSRSPSLKRHTRSRSPKHRRFDSRSPPSHRRSPRRERVRSPHRRRQSRSPRRRDRSRSPRHGRTSSRKSRSPRREKDLSNSQRLSSRNRSPIRKRSKTRGRSPSPRRSSGFMRDLSRSPFKDRQARRQKLTQEPTYDKNHRKKDVVDEVVSIEKKHMNDFPATAVKSDKFSTSQLNSESSHVPTKQITSSQGSPNKLSQRNQLLNQESNSKYPVKAAQLEASPQKSISAQSSMTISSDNSVSSDIYDPEGPILPISPGDSPPLSPLDIAANNNLNYPSDEGEKNDDDMPSSAVQLNQQEKYLQKLNRQERVVEEVKIALKPHYHKRVVDKEQYKDVLRRAVPKICHSKNGEINPIKIRALVDAYVKKMKRRK